MELIAAVLAAVLIHEGGHYLAALAFGNRLRFRFKWGRLFGKLPIPRGLWTMPQMAPWKQRVVALAGFGVEFIVAGILLTTCPNWALWYVPIVLVHFVLYPHYAGENSDFCYWR